MENTYMYIQPQENTLIVYISGLKKNTKMYNECYYTCMHVHVQVMCKFGFGRSVDFIVQTVDSYTRYNMILDNHVYSMCDTTYILSSLQFAIVPLWSAQLLALHCDATLFAAGTASTYVVKAEALVETHTLRAATRQQQLGSG